MSDKLDSEDLRIIISQIEDKPIFPSMNWIFIREILRELVDDKITYETEIRELQKEIDILRERVSYLEVATGQEYD